MCGIAGLWNSSGSLTREVLFSSVESMTDAVRHRGPDAGGIWVDEQMGIALGSRRLAIVDLSAAGHQPMHSSKGRYVLVFNGEIYNYHVLRADLSDATISDDRTWRGHSDTEVLLAGIEQWGLSQTLQQAVGMYVFALWDRSERCLYLGRDRLGEKPLYYGWAGDTLLFGSELKALRAFSAFEGRIDRDALALYLHHSYVPDPYSIYQGIRKLPPSTFLRISSDIEAGALPEPTLYWSLTRAARAGSTSRFAGQEADARAQLDQVLRIAVRQQMVADVPLGAFLSGGIDSSTIVALMQSQSPSPVKTFTIGTHDAGFNEAIHAKAVANHLGTDHTELYVTPDDAMEVIPQLPTLYDEPFADSSQIPTFLVSRLARQHVTVALTGDGGDELFGGYNRYVWAGEIWRRVKRMPAPLRQVIGKGVTSLSPQRWDLLFAKAHPLLPGKLRQTTAGNKMHKLAPILVQPDLDGVYNTLTRSAESQLWLLADNRRVPHRLTDLMPEASITDDISRMMYYDQLTYLPGDILVKVDRASMGVSLETRAPFLDHRVVEFAWQLPVSMKVRDGEGKWLLRQVLDAYVPRELIERPKMGFGIPLGNWLRGPLREWAEDLLNESRLRQEGWLDPVVVGQLWDEHVSGRRNWDASLWNVLMFQAWLVNSRFPNAATASP